MMIVRSKQTKRYATTILLIGRNVKPSKRAVATFLKLDLTKAEFKAARGKVTDRIYVHVRAPLSAITKE